MTEPDNEIIRIARCCYEAIRAYCETLGEHPIPNWEEAADWARQVTIDGVGFQVCNPEVTPEEMHRAWVDEIVAAGWVFGPINDPENKTHPRITDWAQVPREQKAKFYIFGAIVRALV